MPIVLTEFGIVRDVRLVQKAKQPGPIILTEFGILTFVSLSHREKA